MDADSKLCVSYLVGLRDGGYAHEFMQDVAGRLANRVQLTTDGHAAYLQGHIPGAVYASLEDELSDHTITGRGRHPLPSARDVEASARRWGIRQGVPVVVEAERGGSRQHPHVGIGPQLPFHGVDPGAGQPV